MIVKSDIEILTANTLIVHYTNIFSLAQLYNFAAT